MGLALPTILAGGELRAAGYDPLKTRSEAGPLRPELTVHDDKRNRGIRLRIYLPTNTTPAPVVLFRHGLGGSRMGSAFLGSHWAARGYVAVFVQHPGSDDSVWKSEVLGNRMQAIKNAASVGNFLLRVEDIPAVLDQFEIWTTNKTSPLFGRLDLTRIGMSGHSFGALTTQAVCGQSLRSGGQRYTDSRIKAAIAM